MKEPRCYVCGRTAEEAMSFLEKNSGFDENMAAKEEAARTERRSLVEKVGPAVERSDWDFLRKNGLAGLMATERLLERYGDWDRGKLEAAARFGYPFDAGDQKTLEALLYHDRCDPMCQAPRKLSQIRRAAEERLAEMSAEAPSVGRLRDRINVTLEPWGVFEAEGVQVTVCLCSVCKKLMSHVALDSLPDRLLHMDSYYLRG